QTNYQILHRDQTGIEIKGAEHSFHRTPDNRGAHGDPAPDLNIFAKIQTLSDLAKRFPAYKHGSNFRELSFVIFRKTLQQIFAHHEFQNSVTKKLQALVAVVTGIFSGPRAVNERFVKQSHHATRHSKLFQ